jgi:hypothetical protein
MQIPPAIIFINSDFPDQTKNKLITQLYLTEVMSDVEFDNRVLADPNYPVIVHLNNLRILVIREDLQDFTNRTLADIVLFFKLGLATVLYNNYGPPTLSMPIDNINIFNLFANISKTNPLTCLSCSCDCCCNCFKHLPAPLQRMLINKYDRSGVHNANCDNEYNNDDWINRS